MSINPNHKDYTALYTALATEFAKLLAAHEELRAENEALREALALTRVTLNEMRKLV